ncbi:IS200/IS605 family transposase [Ferrovum myxofaciens]|uniref:IS200/IS605 family transposase n=3 Tax=Ferrovum myxofaciens TaxID=416213 RepID=UPI003EC0DCDC
MLASVSWLNYTWSMEKDNEIRHGRHCVFKMHVHLVFVAKYRRKVFDGDAIDRMRRMFGKVCEDMEASLVEMDGEDNHVHLLVEYPPKLAVSVLVNSLKGVSSRLLRKERPFYPIQIEEEFCDRVSVTFSGTHEIPCIQKSHARFSVQGP